MEAKDSIRSGVTIAAAGALAGNLAMLVMPSPPSITLTCAIGVLAVTALFSRHHAPTECIVWACCAFFFTASHAQDHLLDTWPSSRSGDRVRVTAIVETIPAPRGEDWAFDATVRIEAPRPSDRILRARIISRDQSVRPRAGERWRLVLALRPPAAPLNPGGVDLERLLFHDRIHALGTVVGSRQNQLINAGHRPLTSLRESIAARIADRIADREASALIAALAVGATGNVSREQWRIFGATGTTHLVAISGLHVTLFALVMFAIARLLWKSLTWRCFLITRESFAAGFGLSAAGAYAALAGLSIPTQRTLIMIGAWLLARCVARNAAPPQPFALAMLAVLLFDPFAPLTAGFWLSFVAMGTILVVTGTRLTRESRLREALSVQLGVSVALVPFTFAIFGSVSLSGPLVNAAAIPFMSWVLVPVTLAAISLMPIWEQGSNGLLSIAAWLHDLGWPWLAAAADWPGSSLAGSPSGWWYVLAALSLPLVLLPWPLRMRLAAVLCVLPLIATGRERPGRGAFEVVALDVGEGSAFIVNTATRTLVYGTGESYGTDGSRATNAIAPALREVGASQVDVLVVPRVNAITGRGITALLALLPVRTTLLGDAPTLPSFDGAEECGAAEGWIWDSVSFQVFDSCEIGISAGSVRVRLTGGSLRVRDESGGNWTILSGRFTRDGRTRRSVVQSIEHGSLLLSAAESGAIRIEVPSRGALKVEPVHGRWPHLWRSARPGPRHIGRVPPV